MTKNQKPKEDIEKLILENKELQQQLMQARETIDLVKAGYIDALVISDKKLLKVYTEKTADKTYRLLIEKMNEGAVTLNTTGIILYCNSYFAKLVNLPLQKVIGTNFKNFIDETSSECFDFLFKHGWKNALKEEVNIYTNDASTVPVLMSVNNLPLDNDVALSIILTDLTERKKHETELIRANKELIFQNEEKEKRAAELSIANEELAFQSEEKEKRAAELIIANKELAFQSEEKEKRAAELIIANRELAFQSEEKEKRAAELIEQNKKLLEAREKIVKLNENLEATVKERTKELELSRRHFKFLTDHIPQMTFTADIDGTIDYYNAKWYEYTGLSVAQEHETDWNFFLLPDDLPKAVSQWKTSIETGKPYEEEFRIKCVKTNEYRWHLCRALPLKDETGEIVKWFGTCTDIEEQKKENEQKDEFIGIASHELRTPITSLKAYIQLLERDLKEKNTAEATKYVLKARDFVDKINSLVTELHDVTKIQSDKFQLNKTEFNFEEFLTNSIESIQITNNTHQIRKIGVADISILADKQRLQQVLFNYLTNAIKYSPKSFEIVVEVKTTENTLTVSVRDFGLGIPKNEMSKVFQRFFRSSSTKNIEGLGLGLYLCKKIIKAHKGEVWVESQEGEGSTFFFSLPIIKGKEDE